LQNDAMLRAGQWAGRLRSSLSRHLSHHHRSQHSAATIRSNFLEFFRAKDHTVVGSVSVLPHHDPSLAFVNAGMVPWKGVFQGKRAAPAPRLANSQRCVRVGGKHNDLDVVGTDGSHLTMFEMLGSWSFADYWKAEAVGLAWELLTRHYNLDPARLTVTYFGGCEALGLGEDGETRAAWLELGLPSARLLPRPASENFWEMGLAGPCGPCTELHWSGPDGLLTEVWNLVFMEWERQVGVDTLAPLPARHVDTGLGLERLTALLNRPDTAPDVFTTDLLAPLVKQVAGLTGHPPYSGQFGPAARTDTAYRLLADHARMITVCLADGALPDTNAKVRAVLRRAQTVARTGLGTKPGLLAQLSHSVMEILSPHHPTLQENHNRVLAVLEFEEENMTRLLVQGQKFLKKLKSDYPDIAEKVQPHEAINFYEALKYLEKEVSDGVIDGAVGFKLYETHGLQKTDIQRLGELANYEFRRSEFVSYLAREKQRSKLSTALQQQDSQQETQFPPDLAATLDMAKYGAVRAEGPTEYTLPRLTTRLMAVSSGGSLVDGELTGPAPAVLVTEQTNFYSQAGGQAGDRGEVRGSNGVFTVTDTRQFPGGLVAHIGQLEPGSVLLPGEQVELSVDMEWRAGCMRAHTATHLLNSALHTLLPATGQRSSSLTCDTLKFDFSVFQTEFDRDMVEKVEREVQKMIDSKTEIQRTQITREDLRQVKNLVLLPGESYPTELFLVNTGQHSEPCCGTHLANTADVITFVVISLRSTSPGVRSAKCLTGPKATKAQECGNEYLAEILNLENELTRLCAENPCNAESLQLIQKKLYALEGRVRRSKIPFLIAEDLRTELVRLKNTVSGELRVLSKESAMNEMMAAVQSQEDQPYFCYYLDLSHSQKFSLSKALKLVSRQKPALLLCRVGRELKGTAVVPRHLVSPRLTARQLLEVAAAGLGGAVTAPRGQDPATHCNMAAVTGQPDQTVMHSILLAEQWLQNLDLEQELSR